MERSRMETYGRDEARSVSHDRFFPLPTLTVSLSLARATVGTPTLSTSSHVSLLLHNLFNASIPSSHIPRDQYEFDPTCPVPAVVLERRQQQPKPQKSVEELEQAAQKAKREALGIDGDEAEEDSDAEDEEMPENEDDDEEEFAEVGWWVDKQTRQPLGGSQGRIEFTLVS